MTYRIVHVAAVTGVAFHLDYVEARDDGEAIARSRRPADFAEQVEVWCGDRLLGRWTSGGGVGGRTRRAAAA